MCGITGICEPSPDDRVDRARLQAMTDVIRHRGPDGDGIHITGNIGLGHRRLSIIDLGGGAQPMANATGDLIVTFNGEIYNYVELMGDLRSDGYTFQTSSDTEVILHAYAAHGDGCVEHFNGMFAFALWDDRQRRLLIARDRMGKKPLYYHFDNGRLIYSSELKALLQHPRVPTEVCPHALDEYLAYGYVPEDRCIIRGVKKLPPGCLLTWQDGRIEIKHYWDVHFNDEQPTDERAWVAELENLLRDAVRIRLRSDVPLGVFLSGGVDSSAIVALASQESDTQLRTFAIGFDEAEFDELHYARMVADRYKTDHTEIVVRDHDLSMLSDIVYHLDEPFADPSALPTYYVCREARKHVTVCLSGDGGDEVFAGYSRYRHALAQAKWDWLLNLGGRGLAKSASRIVPRHWRGRGMIDRAASRGAARYALQIGIFDESERAALLGSDASRIQSAGALFAPYFANRNGHSLTTVLQHVDQKSYLPDDILVKVDRMSMQNSLEVRAPLLDYRVVEFVNKVSAGWKIRDGQAKHALKKLLEPHLPHDVLYRKKMGFGIPIKHWFRGRQKEYVRELLLSSESRATEWIDRTSVERLLDDHVRGQRDLSQKIWAIVVFEHWCRRVLQPCPQVATA